MFNPAVCIFIEARVTSFPFSFILFYDRSRIETSAIDPFKYFNPIQWSAFLLSKNRSYIYIERKREKVAFGIKLVTKQENKRVQKCVIHFIGINKLQTSIIWLFHFASVLVSSRMPLVISLPQK